MPLEVGQLATPTSQRTVTGAGCIILSDGCRPDAKKAYSGCSVVVSCGTIGRVIDLGITDANNMGAAMAPAAADTIVTHLKDFNKTVDDYDIIVTGDLGTFGTEMLREVFEKLHLSARSYDRIIKVARTVADLDGKSGIEASHVAEAISYRNMIPRR